MARPLSDISRFIMSADPKLTAADVVKAAKAKGLKTSLGNVHRVRAMQRKLAKGSKAKAPLHAAAPSKGHLAHGKSAAHATSSLSAFRAAALALGLDRARAELAALEKSLAKLING